MATTDQVRIAYDTWHSAIASSSSRLPPKGIVSGILCLLENLREEFTLDIRDHVATGQGQLRKVSGKRVKTILRRYGIDKTFTSEGGRTNRGLMGAATQLLKNLSAIKADSLTEDEKIFPIDSMQQWLVLDVIAYQSRTRLKFPYDSHRTIEETFRLLLVEAHSDGRDGPMAEYLVGAKLQLRHPNIKIRNTSYSTSDDQHGESGDFQINDTVFHVSIAPSFGHYEKCKANLEAGLDVSFLVPASKLQGTRQIVEQEIGSRVSVLSIEPYLAHNIEEIGEHSRLKKAAALVDLLDIYNLRVDEVENDKSLLIECPEGLRRAAAKLRDSIVFE